jgi:uncharacterized protein
MRAVIFAMVLAAASGDAASAEILSLDHTITIDGEATIYVDPDHASIPFGVITNGATVGEALSQNNLKMNAVLSALRALGIKSSEMQTSAFSIQPLHPANKNGGYDYNQISGYSVSNSVTATVSDLTKVGAVIDAAATAGANTSNSVTFEISNREEILDKARAAAMRNAKHKADIMANAVGASVGGLITVGNTMVRSTAYENAPPPPPPAMMSASPVTEILSGQLSVTANVTAVFSLK